MWAIAIKLLTNKTSLTIIGLVVIGISIFGVYKYQQYVIHKYDTLIQEQKEINNTLNTSLEKSKKLTEHLIQTNNELISKLDKAISNLNKLNDQNNQVRESIENIKKQVSDPRLERLAKAKPGLIESRVNKATADVFKQLQEETKNE